METIYQNDAKAVGAMSAEQRAAFEQWMTALDAEHSKRGLPYGEGPLATTTGVECWISYFADGYAPRDALDEDATYWTEWQLVDGRRVVGRYDFEDQARREKERREQGATPRVD